MLGNVDVSVEEPPDPVAAQDAEPGLWEGVQLRIARRADELAKNASPLFRRGSGRLLWVKAEREILGPRSRVALTDLLQLCARLSQPAAR